MVAPADPRRIKWRNHCSTCGKVFPLLQKWAYCSKDCERSRRGADLAEGGPVDEWLEVLHEERLRLHRELEDAPKYQHDGIRARITTNVLREAEMRAELARINAPRDSLDFWAPRLRADADRFELTLRRSFVAAMRLGRRLVDARAALDYGNFGRLFRDHETPVEHALPFGRKWAHRLMRVAEHPVLANQEHSAALPVDLNTVYELSRVPTDRLEEAIARGEVTPSMRRADVRALLPVDDQAEDPEPPADDEIARFLSPVQAALTTFACDHPSQFGDLKARLKAMLRAIENTLRGPVDECGGTQLMPAAARGDMAP